MKTIKNKWMLEKFIPSFGLCQNRSISPKQAEVFMRYLEELKDNGGYTTCFGAKLKDISICMTKWHCATGTKYYVTIAKNKDIFEFTNLGIHTY